MIINLTGRIDSSNASEAEKEIMDRIGSEEGSGIVFDAAGLSYISSAGLRVLMKVRKLKDQPLKIINVSRDVYDIFETTGFTELFDVRKEYRTISLDGLEVIARGFYGTVYRIDDETIVKMYKGKEIIPMIENEKAMARKAFLAGIPTAISYDIVKAGEDYGAVFELLNARTFHDIILSNEIPFDEVIKKYTDLLKLVHNTSLETGVLPSYREKFLYYLESIREHLTDTQYRGLKSALDNTAEENTVVHADIHMKNVMLSGDEAMLIDMDTLGLGNPVFAFAGLYVTYHMFKEDDPNNPMSFLDTTEEMVDRIWNGIFESYFDDKDEAEKEVILKRIIMAAAIRFLYIIESTDLKHDELAGIRIEHTKEHIDRLLKEVDTLSI